FSRDWSSDVCSSDLAGEWEGGFSSEGGLAGLAQVQDLMTNASLAPKDGQETDLQVPFCEGKVAFLSAPTWIQWSINAPEEPETRSEERRVGKEQRSR